MNEQREEKEPLLLMEGVDIFYDEKPAVQDFSVRLEEGEILGIVGESGSGKTTLLKGILGLLGPEGSIRGGRIFFQGRNLLEVSGEELRRLRGPGIGMVFQNAGASLCPVRTVGDQLFEAVREHERTTKEEVMRRAGELFEKICFKDPERTLKSYPFELSGGMNQRAGIVMAMLLNPALLLADEPTSALDVTTQAQAAEEMLRIREEFHTGIILVTHNIGLVERMADKVAVMRRGRLIEYGEKSQILESPKEEYTRQLIQAVPRLKRRRQS